MRQIGWGRIGGGSQGRQLSEDNVPGNRDRECMTQRWVMLGMMEEEERKQWKPDPQGPWRSTSQEVGLYSKENGKAPAFFSTYPNLTTRQLWLGCY